MNLKFNRSTLDYLATYFQSLCANLTAESITSTDNTDNPLTTAADITNATDSDVTTDAETAFDAIIFITVVLSFYSVGVVVMLVMYMREEKKDYEEEKVVQGYFKMMTQKPQQHVIITAVINPAHLLSRVATVRPTTSAHVNAIQV